MVVGVIMFKKIYVEITNACNLNCSFCIQNKREKAFLSMEQFRILLDRLDSYTNYLYFHVMGEPLFHPNINEMIDLASQRFFVNITSNGYLIEKIKGNKNIRQLNLSLHSFDLKNGKSLDQYMKDIIESATILSSCGTIIYYRMWTNCKDKDFILSYLERQYHVTIGDKKQVKLDSNIYYGVEPEFIWPSYDNSFYQEVGSCRGTRDHIGILVDGTVIPCCLDSQGSIPLGNIYQQSLNEIIDSDLFRKLKQGFLDNKKIHPLCKKCHFYQLRK